MKRNLTKNLLTVFLLFIGFTSFAQEQKVGRISLEIRATEEEASSSRYYYYATFLCTLPRTYVGIETFIDEAEKLKLYPGSYFRRIPDGFEVKATYLRGQKNALLRFWMDIDASGASNAGMIPFIAYLMGNDHNLRVEFSGDRHTFDYEWLNRGYFEKQGYFKYGVYYDFYKQD